MKSMIHDIKINQDDEEDGLELVRKLIKLAKRQSRKVEETGSAHCEVKPINGANLLKENNVEMTSRQNQLITQITRDELNNAMDESNVANNDHSSLGTQVDSNASNDSTVEHKQVDLKQMSVDHDNDFDNGNESNLHRHETVNAQNFHVSGGENISQNLTTRNAEKLECVNENTQLHNTANQTKNQLKSENTHLDKDSIYGAKEFAKKADPEIRPRVSENVPNTITKDLNGVSGPGDIPEYIQKQGVVSVDSTNVSNENFQPHKNDVNLNDINQRNDIQSESHNDSIDVGSKEIPLAEPKSSLVFKIMKLANPNDQQRPNSFSNDPSAKVFDQNDLKLSDSLQINKCSKNASENLVPDIKTEPDIIECYSKTKKKSPSTFNVDRVSLSSNNNAPGAVHPVQPQTKLQNLFEMGSIKPATSLVSRIMQLAQHKRPKKNNPLDNDVQILEVKKEVKEEPMSILEPSVPKMIQPKPVSSLEPSQELDNTKTDNREISDSQCAREFDNNGSYPQHILSKPNVNLINEEKQETLTETTDGVNEMNQNLTDSQTKNDQPSSLIYKIMKIAESNKPEDPIVVPNEIVTNDFGTQNQLISRSERNFPIYQGNTDNVLNDYDVSNSSLAPEMIDFNDNKTTVSLVDPKCSTERDIAQPVHSYHARGNIISNQNSSESVNENHFSKSFDDNFNNRGKFPSKTDISLSSLTKRTYDTLGQTHHNAYGSDHQDDDMDEDLDLVRKLIRLAKRPSLNKRNQYSTSQLPEKISSRNDASIKIPGYQNTTSSRFVPQSSYQQPPVEKNVHRNKNFDKNQSYNYPFESTQRDFKESVSNYHDNENTNSGFSAKRLKQEQWQKNEIKKDSRPGTFVTNESITNRYSNNIHSTQEDYSGNISISEKLSEIPQDDSSTLLSRFKRVAQRQKPLPVPKGEDSYITSDMMNTGAANQLYNNYNVSNSYNSNYTDQSHGLGVNDVKVENKDQFPQMYCDTSNNQSTNNSFIPNTSGYHEGNESFYTVANNDINMNETVSKDMYVNHAINNSYSVNFQENVPMIEKSENRTEQFDPNQYYDQGMTIYNAQGQYYNSQTKDIYNNNYQPQKESNYRSEYDLSQERAYKNFQSGVEFGMYGNDYGPNDNRNSQYFNNNDMYLNKVDPNVQANYISGMPHHENNSYYKDGLVSRPNEDEDMDEEEIIEEIVSDTDEP